MKIPSTICLFFAGLIISQNLSGQEACSLQNISFEPGEKIRYQVYYNIGFLWIPAGICDFETSMTTWATEVLAAKPAVVNPPKNPAPESHTALHLKATGITHRAYDPFFSVRDTLESYVNPLNLIPYEGKKYTHEGKWHGQDNFLFQPSDTSEGWNIRTQLKRREVWKDPVYEHTRDCGFDIISSVYRMRNIPDERLFSGQAIHIPVRLDDGQYDVWLSYKGKALIKLHRGKTHHAHYFELSLIEGSVFKKGDVLKLWLGNDLNRLPLQIESPIRVGSVKAVFEYAENLRYPQENSK
ncbi:MAG: DUF3108 domain-containing protein [Bacteroidales bacterium]|jgi:hypothetical protein|nr:DUF3108 domain-containing protein [Bacteroidales bacterium]MDD2617336.1 DUF3108 domain-containing protein [Bacteroidales bacterium]MDD4640223.1 DUF3108 domain-containing protein [Bacteroidales bacterium]NLB01961.1 DUF3108 domain-containing protein [Bacteroidales bacterium]